MQQKSFTRGIQRSCSHASIGPVRWHLRTVISIALIRFAAEAGGDGAYPSGERRPLGGGRRVRAVRALVGALGVDAHIILMRRYRNASRIPRSGHSFKRSCTVKNLRHCRETSLAHLSWSWPIPKAWRNLCDALREAVAAHRRYEWLRSRGVPHDAAVMEALSIGHATCECRATDRGQRGAASKPVLLRTSASIGTLSFVK